MPLPEEMLIQVLTINISYTLPVPISAWAPPLNLLMSKFLNTSEFIIMINSRQILNLSW
jgi:hypothetical protein